ncbi:MAG: DUF881 domain-containing protein [Armatimonadota bacterium]|nr:DUF881 domain-containing protein [Armatimonadota bacterium]MDR5702733.1 DUF881 domain-containing protein [Armatimonadota bacterium]
MSRDQFGLALVLALAGFLLIVQIRSGQRVTPRVELPSLRVRELAILIQQQKEAQEALEAEVQRLYQRLNTYREGLAQGKTLARELSEEIRFYRTILGFTPVRGPGVVVILKEGKAFPPLVKPIVQASDLSGLVNELWSAGAEAVAINGFRILATTGFSQEGSAIVAGSHRLKPPYVIEAIGDPEALKNQLGLPGGFVDGLQSVGFSVTIKEKRDIRIPPYRGPIGKKS